MANYFQFESRGPCHPEADLRPAITPGRNQDQDLSLGQERPILENLEHPILENPEHPKEDHRDALDRPILASVEDLRVLVVEVAGAMETGRTPKLAMFSGCLV